MVKLKSSQRGRRLPKLLDVSVPYLALTQSMNLRRLLGQRYTTPQCLRGLDLLVFLRSGKLREEIKLGGCRKTYLHLRIWWTKTILPHLDELL